MTPSPSIRPYLGVVAAAGLLLAGGVAYRALAAYVGAELATPIRLDPPLATLPLVLGPWHGEDVPVREGVLRIAGNDDYVSRSYRHGETGEVVSLYIGYTARPRTMLRHRPSVCYPSAGWAPLTTTDEQLPIGTPTPLPPREGLGEGESDRTFPRSRLPTCPPARGEGFGEGQVSVHHRGTETQSETAATESVPRNFPPPQGGVGGGSERPAVPTQLPVRLHGFLRPGVPEQRVVVLNYYVLNGTATIDEHSFWGLSWRDPNRGRDATRYVAQVQIAAAVRTTPDAAADLVRRFAADSAPAILPLLPAATDAAPLCTGDSP